MGGPHRSILARACAMKSIIPPLFSLDRAPQEPREHRASRSARSLSTTSDPKLLSVAKAAIDDDPQTDWSTEGGQGRARPAAFSRVAPPDGARELSIQLR